MVCDGFFGWDRLLLPEEIVEYYVMVSSNCVDDDILTEPRHDGSPPYWDYKMLPFTRNNSSLLCVHSETGEVMHHDSSGGLGGCWPSIEATLREVVEGVRVAQREKPSWRSYLPPGASDIHEWGDVSLYLPTCLWYMLKARISVNDYEHFKTALSLLPDLRKKHPADHPWSSSCGFEEDWWDVSQGIKDTWYSEKEGVFHWQAKYENGYLYFKVWQVLT